MFITHNYLYQLRVRVRVFNATFNNISVRIRQFHWWRKPANLYDITKVQMHIQYERRNIYSEYVIYRSTDCMCKSQPNVKVITSKVKKYDCHYDLVNRYSIPESKMTTYMFCFSWSQSCLSSLFIIIFKATRRVPRVERELLIFPEHPRWDSCCSFFSMQCSVLLTIA